MLTEFWLGGRFSARFGVIDSRPFTGCNRVAYLPGIPTGAAASTANIALFGFFRHLRNGNPDAALSGFLASVNLAGVGVVFLHGGLGSVLALRWKWGFERIEVR